MIPFGELEFLISTGRLVSGRVWIRLVLDIGRLGMREMFAFVGVVAIRRHHAKIVLGVLKISFGYDAIPRGGGFSSEHKVFFHDLACIATDRRAITPASLVP